MNKLESFASNWKVEYPIGSGVPLGVQSLVPRPVLQRRKWIFIVGSMCDRKAISFDEKTFFGQI